MCTDCKSPNQIYDYDVTPIKNQDPIVAGMPNIDRYVYPNQPKYQIWSGKVFQPPKIKTVYLIGSLKNRKIMDIETRLRDEGFDPFASWLAPGPDADDFLRDYERSQGRSYKEILNGYAARHIFNFDKFHLDRCDCCVMVMPCGKSGHLELGYTIGRGKKGYILFEEEPERVDVMHGFATDIFFDLEQLVKTLHE